jgi:hypothetical protein
VEEFRAVSFDKNYEVSSAGRIFRLNWGKSRYEIFGGLDERGYSRVNIKGRKYRLHRLVAAAFIPNPLSLETVNHIDGNKTNNDVRNLEWMTSGENASHGHKMGLFSKNKKRGEKHPLGKLDDIKCLTIRTFALAGHDSSKCRKAYSVWKETINKCASGETWSHLPVFGRSIEKIQHQV